MILFSGGYPFRRNFVLLVVDFDYVQHPLNVEVMMAALFQNKTSMKQIRNNLSVRKKNFDDNKRHKDKRERETSKFLSE